MAVAVYLIKNTALVLIGVLELAMLARAILSWFDQTGEGGFSVFLYTVTEPVIYPVRKLCERMHWFEGIPIDIPFTLTWLILMVIQILLETFI
ncbi:MAG: YggT family protein [Ruminococcaceae bacterium]|nr:YggT family protein [Oscillospiraceae bacterium]